MGEVRSETAEGCKAGGSVGDKIEMLRQAAVSLSVGSKFTLILAELVLIFS